MKNWCDHAFQNQLLLCACLHGKPVIPLACERVITCRVRALALFPDIPWTAIYQLLSQYTVCAKQLQIPIEPRAYKQSSVFSFLSSHISGVKTLLFAPLAVSLPAPVTASGWSQAHIHMQAYIFINTTDLAHENFRHNFCLTSYSTLGKNTPVLLGCQLINPSLLL